MLNFLFFLIFLNLKLNSTKFSYFVCYYSKHSLEGGMFVITEELNNLKKEFERIKKMGYVKATRSGYTGIGKTFEDLLGKKEDSLELPDYHGIEIKTKRGYSNSYTTLFGATPQGKKEFEIKRLRSAYGYPDSVYKSQKLLQNSVQANCSTLIGGKFLFKLVVDYEQQKIFLLITDMYMNFIEKKSYWTFEALKTKLERKLQYLALVKAWPNEINGEMYYKYYDIDFYKLKDFEEFIKLIEDGTIRITFKIGIFKKGARAGELHDRGTSFEIQEIDMYKLFDKIEV